MQSRPNRTAKQKDRLAARITRGSQPARRRVKGQRFSKEHQPKRPRGRPKGRTNQLTRNLKEAILGGCEDCGLDGKGTGGLRGYMKRLAMEDTKTMGTLVRSMLPTEAKAEVARLGLPPAEIYKLEYYKDPLIDVEAAEST
jgi:hypothetical protein